MKNKKIYLLICNILITNCLTISAQNENNSSSNIDKTHKKILEKEAINFINDYTTTLNVLVNPSISSDNRWDINDYFETDSAEVFSGDLFCNGVGMIQEMKAKDYHKFIEIFFPDGLIFSLERLKIEEMNYQGENCFIKFRGKRQYKIPDKKWRRKSKLFFYVKLPIESQSKISPKITKITSANGQ